VLARGPQAAGESRHLAPGDVVHGERDVHRLGEREADPRTVDAGVRDRPGELHAVSAGSPSPMAPPRNATPVGNEAIVIGRIISLSSWSTMWQCHT
jgi:hypothetical protein